MLLKPISTVLTEAGVLQKSPGRGKISEILDAKGMSLEETAENLRELSTCGEPSIRMKATEMSFKLHGVLKEAEQQQVPAITFILQGDNNKLATILTPRE